MNKAYRKGRKANQYAKECREKTLCALKDKKVKSNKQNHDKS